MGDRGNIKVGGVYLYTHLGGYKIKQTLLKALRRRQRWNDCAYLTRIIFCEMLDGNLDGETGFGISTRICDNEHNILEVDCDNQKIRELLDDTSEIVKEWTFEEFLKQEIIDALKDEEEEE